MIFPVSTLASESYFGEILAAVGVLIFLVLAVVVVGIALHRKFVHTPPDDSPALPFDLHQLRQMHEAGQLTQAEYDRAVAGVVARQAADASPPTNLNHQDTQPPPETPPPTPENSPE